MYDIVIPYKRNTSGELRSSLSLIDKNVPHRRVYVVEDFDKKKNSNVTHINQILKIKWAIENLELTEDFYLYNDDFFVLEPVKDTPYYHKGTIQDHIDSRKYYDYYTRSLRSTLSCLDDGALSYEMHVPFLFNRDKLYELIISLEDKIESGECPLIRSYYGNAYNVGGEYMEDVKNVKDFVGKTYLSTTESTFRGKVGDYVRSMI